MIVNSNTEHDFACFFFFVDGFRFVDSFVEIITFDRGKEIEN